MCYLQCVEVIGISVFCGDIPVKYKFLRFRYKCNISCGVFVIINVMINYICWATYVVILNDNSHCVASNI